jgi:hypothetical protein
MTEEERMSKKEIRIHWRACVCGKPSKIRARYIPTFAALIIMQFDDSVNSTNKHFP